MTHGTKLKKADISEEEEYEVTEADVIARSLPFQGTKDIAQIVFRLIKIEERLEALEKK